MNETQTAIVPASGLATFHSQEELNPYRIAQEQFDHAAQYIPGLKAGIIEFLKRPIRMVAVEFPVEMDDGSVKTLVGYRAVHSRVRGPGKGGIRYHPSHP